MQRIAKSAIGNSTVVSVPKVHHFDEEACIIIMDDAGENTQTLKQLLLDSPRTLTEPLATQIGSELGTFIAQLHNWGSSDIAAETREWAAGHSLAKQIAVYATYERILSTLEGADGSVPDLRDPPLELRGVSGLKASEDVGYVTFSACLLLSLPLHANTLCSSCTHCYNYKVTNP